MKRREVENYTEKVLALMRKITKAPRTNNAVVFLGREEQTIKQLLLPAPKSTKLK